MNRMRGEDISSLLDGHALGEVPRLVHVCALENRYVIGEELQRHCHEYGGELHRGGRHRYDVVHPLARLRVPFVDDGYDTSAPGLDLLQVGEHLGVRGVPRGEGHHGDILVYQRDGAVLHLACRVSLGVYVGYLLQLQRPLEGDGVVYAAPEVDEVPQVEILFRQGLYVRLSVEYLLDLLGEPYELSYEVFSARGVYLS